MQSNEIVKNNKFFDKNPLNRLLLSCSVFSAGVIASLATVSHSYQFPTLLKSVFSLIPDFSTILFSNQFQEKFLSNITENGLIRDDELNHAIGKAILSIILDESHNKDFGIERQILKYIGNSSIERWNNWITEETSRSNIWSSPGYEESGDVLLINISQDFMAALKNDSEIKSLSVQDWSEIIYLLSKNSNFFLRPQSVNKLAVKLTNAFSDKLRQVLTNDLEENGKSYARFQLALLKGIASQTKETEKINEKINEILSEILESIPSFAQQNNEIFNKLAIASLLKPTTKFIPSKTFPIRPLNFLGRKKALYELKRALEFNRKASLVGISGIGKTTLALEYAYSNADNYEYICFIRATVKEFFQEVTRCAESVGIISFIDTTYEENAGNFTKWLTEHENFLLIFDNIEDIDLIQPFINLIHNGHILLTSNFNLAEISGPQIIIETFPSMEAELLLYQSATHNFNASYDDISSENRVVIKEIINNLQGLPLAINIVGAYVFNNQLSFVEFLEKLKTSLNKVRNNNFSDSNYFNDSIASVFSLILNKISIPEDKTSESEQVAAISLLLLKMSTFFSPVAIPIEIFLYSITRMPNLIVSDKEAELFLKRAFVNIEKFGLFLKDFDNQTLDTHPLVQKLIYKKIEFKERLEIGELNLKSLVDLFPEYEYTNKKICERFLHHVVTLLEIANELEIRDKNSIILYARCGRFYELLGNLKQSNYFYTKCYEISRSLLGENHPDTATSLNNLGNVYRLQGKYDEAEKYHQIGLGINLNVLGANHPDTATSYNNLGNIYRSQGRYTEAEEYYQKALEIFLKIFGENHPNIAISYSNLGDVYYSLGDYQKAKENFQKALQLSLILVGENHPNTATGYGNLGLVYFSLGNFFEAEEYYQKALEIFLKIFGENHPNIAISYSNLGDVYYSLGDYQKAKENFQKALEIRLGIFGHHHPNTAVDYNNLGSLYENLRDFEKAEKNYYHALDIFENLLPENHPYILTVKKNLSRMEKKIRTKKDAY